MRKFIYKFRMKDGRYIEAEGYSWDDAARNAGELPENVKRHLPVATVKTPEELAAQAERLEKLRKRKQAEEETE